MWISRILRSSLIGLGAKGKSTVAVNLALAYTMLNSAFRIGLMDADVFGPSIPQMMSLEGIEPEVNEKNLIIPLQNYGIKTMSMGSLIKKDSAVVWRGLMVMSAIQQLLRKVAWGPLDTLFVDTPPGTGDVQLSISQNIPVQGAVIVTTSHSLSLADTRRGIEMMLKLKVSPLCLRPATCLHSTPEHRHCAGTPLSHSGH
uniref:Iron-sulfur protein NUBPL n=1 Tax=Schistocephalus solidus TaxID=70667 RepID=A0A0X3NY42_SCHSO